MGIIYMSFLSRNLHCKNIYTMSSFSGVKNFLVYWNDDYTSTVFFYLVFLTYEVSYSTKKFFLEEMRNLFLRLTYPKLYFEDQIFAISDQNHKNRFCNNLWSRKFLLLRWVNKLFAYLLTYKQNTKVSVCIKFGEGLLTSWNSFTAR